MIPTKNGCSGLNPWMESHRICTACLLCEAEINGEKLIEFGKEIKKKTSCSSCVLDRKSLYNGSVHSVYKCTFENYIFDNREFKIPYVAVPVPVVDKPRTSPRRDVRTAS